MSDGTQIATFFNLREANRFCREFQSSKFYLTMEAGGRESRAYSPEYSEFAGRETWGRSTIRVIAREWLS